MKVIVSGGRVAERKVKRVSTRHHPLMRTSYDQLIRDVADRIISDVRIDMGESEGRPRVATLTSSESRELQMQILKRARRSRSETVVPKKHFDITKDQLTGVAAFADLSMFSWMPMVGHEGALTEYVPTALAEQRRLEQAVEDLSTQASELALLMCKTVKETVEANERISAKLDETQKGFLENQKQLDRLEALMKTN